MFETDSAGKPANELSSRLQTELDAIQPDDMTAREALDLLYRWKSMLDADK
jgi:hypothetical protein